MIVREVRVGDLDVCGGWAGEAGVPSWNPSALESCLADKYYDLLIAEREGIPAGFGLARGVADEVAVFVLAVGAAHRRFGVGRALFAALCAVAERRRAVRLTLEVRADNSGARAFYRAMGLEAVGRRAAYYSDGQDAVLMNLELVSSATLRPDLVILAGGRGLRLGGVNKACLRRGQQTLLERTLEALGPVTDQAYVVAPEDLARQLPAGPYQWIPDAGEGPARALVRAAAAVQAPWIFVAAVDHVFWTKDLVTRLGPEARPAFDAVLVRDRGELQPFGALYRTASIRRVGLHHRSLKDVRSSMVIREIAAEKLDSTLRRAFLDVDVPADLRWLEERTSFGGFEF